MTTFLTQLSDYLATPDIPLKKYSIVRYYVHRFACIKRPGDTEMYEYGVLSDEFFEQYEDKLLSLANGKYRETNSKMDLQAL